MNQHGESMTLCSDLSGSLEGHNHMLTVSSSANVYKNMYDGDRASNCFGKGGLGGSQFPVGGFTEHQDSCDLSLSALSDVLPNASTDAWLATLSSRSRTAHDSSPANNGGKSSSIDASVRPFSQLVSHKRRAHLVPGGASAVPPKPLVPLAVDSRKQGGDRDSVLGEQSTDCGLSSALEGLAPPSASTDAWLASLSANSPHINSSSVATAASPQVVKAGFVEGGGFNEVSTPVAPVRRRARGARPARAVTPMSPPPPRPPLSRQRVGVVTTGGGRDQGNVVGTSGCGSREDSNAGDVEDEVTSDTSKPKQRAAVEVKTNKNGGGNSKSNGSGSGIGTNNGLNSTGGAKAGRAKGNVNSERSGGSVTSKESGDNSNISGGSGVEARPADSKQDTCSWSPEEIRVFFTELCRQQDKLQQQRQARMRRQRVQTGGVKGGAVGTSGSAAPALSPGPATAAAAGGAGRFELISRAIGSKSTEQARQFYYRLLKRAAAMLKPLGYRVDPKVPDHTRRVLRCWYQVWLASVDSARPPKLDRPSGRKRFGAALLRALRRSEERASSVQARAQKRAAEAEEAGKEALRQRRRQGRKRARERSEGQGVGRVEDDEADNNECEAEGGSGGTRSSRSGSSSASASSSDGEVVGDGSKRTRRKRARTEADKNAAAAQRPAQPRSGSSGGDGGGGGEDRAQGDGEGEGEGGWMEPEAGAEVVGVAVEAQKEERRRGKDKEKKRGRDRDRDRIKVVLQLLPRGRAAADVVAKAGHNPLLELTLRASRSVASVVAYTTNKWGLSLAAAAAMRLLPVAERGHPGWGAADTTLTCQSILSRQNAATLRQPDGVVGGGETALRLKLEYYWPEPEGAGGSGGGGENERETMAGVVPFVQSQHNHCAPWGMGNEEVGPSGPVAIPAGQQPLLMMPPAASSAPLPRSLPHPVRPVSVPLQLQPAPPVGVQQLPQQVSFSQMLADVQAQVRDPATAPASQQPQRSVFGDVFLSGASQPPPQPSPLLAPAPAPSVPPMMWSSSLPPPLIPGMGTGSAIDTLPVDGDAHAQDIAGFEGGLELDFSLDAFQAQQQHHMQLCGRSDFGSGGGEQGGGGSLFSTVVSSSVDNIRGVSGSASATAQHPAPASPSTLLSQSSCVPLPPDETSVGLLLAAAVPASMPAFDFHSPRHSTQATRGLINDSGLDLNGSPPDHYPSLFSPLQPSTLQQQGGGGGVRTYALPDSTMEEDICI